jgi:hypothetical protein
MLMTDISCSHLTFMNSHRMRFSKTISPANLGYHPILACSGPFIFSQMVISLMLATNGNIIYTNGKWEILFMNVNDQYHLFSFDIREQSLNEIFKTISSC